MTGLLSAVGFLTVVPVGKAANSRVAGANWYPAAGLLAGGFVALVWLGAFELWGPGVVAAAVTVGAWVAVTGALHLDGLADSADASLASVPAERRREILRDVHHGTFATVAVVLVLLLKLAALTTMEQAGGAAALLIATVGARGLLPLALRISRPLPGSQLAGGVRSQVTVAGLAMGAGIALLASAGALGLEGLAALAAGCLAGLAVLGWMHIRLGGVGGDALGAAVEVFEVAVLLFAAAFFAHNRGEAFAAWPG